jgi:D-sedoheptulose 7-phosphate isomerase
MEYPIQRLFDESLSTIRLVREQLGDRIRQAADIIVASYRSGGGLLLFGNGGSADAQHIACEMVGRLMFDRPPLKAEALSTNTSSLTCLANDYDYESIFARQIEANGGERDVAVGLSTSGNSPNVVAGLAKGRQIGMKTIALTGEGGGKCAEFADVLLDVPGTNLSPRVQEAHMVIYHIICELVESAIFGED